MLYMRTFGRPAGATTFPVCGPVQRSCLEPRGPVRLACRSLCARSDEVGDVHGHLLDLGVVEPLEVLHGAHVVIRHKIDGNALAAEAAATTDAVQVVLHVRREVI